MRLPPVLVFAIPILIGWAVDRSWPASGFAFQGQKFIALIAIIAAFLLLLLAVTGFRLKKTTVNPMDPAQASALVDDGIYRISRNPMYLGMALFTFAVSVGQGWPAGLLLLPFAIWYINENQIRPEESALRQHFGYAYDAYCQKVRRWI